MLIDGKPASYDELYAEFSWNIPDEFNIGTVCSDAVAARTPETIAIVDEEDGVVSSWTFAELSKLSNRFANVLASHGIARGDRVAIMAPQSIQTAVVHLAIYKSGAIAVPMAQQFGADAIAYRLRVSGAKLFVTDTSTSERIDAALKRLDERPAIIVTDTAEADPSGFWALCDNASNHFISAKTAPDDPAMMLFTSGTTGQPKAALHGHRVLAGHMPGIQLSQDFMPQSGDRMWTPSDWAWAGGLLNMLLPSLALGVSVVAARTAKFDPLWAARLMKDLSIRNAFMPATAIRLMLAAGVTADDGPGGLRSLASAGEALGERTLAAVNDRWGVTVNEFYGQTECNAVLAASNALKQVAPGAMGKPTPGHQVAVLGADNEPLKNGGIGQVAIRKPDPVMFLEYWKDPQATEEKFADEWLLTGDQARIDEAGFFHFVGRTDDVITSSGYRIGPAEIEDVLISHPDIKLAAVVGKPDEVRTEIVVAYVAATDGHHDQTVLSEELKTLVRQRLSPHQLPREIHFVDDIPMTETGKIIRRHFRTAR